MYNLNANKKSILIQTEKKKIVKKKVKKIYKFQGKFEVFTCLTFL